MGSKLPYYEKIKLNPDYKEPGDYQNVEFDEIIPLPDVVLPEFPVNSLPSAIKNYCLEVAESTTNTTRHGICFLL